jgi:hypothetical protein
VIVGNFTFRRQFCRKVKNQTPTVLQTAKRAKKNSSENFTDGYSVGDCGMAVNILELSVNYRWIYFVRNSNGKYRQNISIGDCGMGGNFFVTLGKIPTAWFRL